jgi:folate-dependent phosphoribosylglycinamide formyltransferase PurN
MIVNLAILTTNSRNSENIIQHFSNFSNTKVQCIISNKDNDNLFNQLRRYKIDTYTTNQYVEIDNILNKHNIHYIILDGYEDKIPLNFCKKYKFKIINLHLLPLHDPLLFGDDKFNFIKNNHNDNIGINIYFIDSDYYKGLSIFKKIIKIDSEYDITDIKSAIDKLEKSFYPVVIEKTIKNTFNKLYGND